MKLFVLAQHHQHKATSACRQLFLLPKSLMLKRFTLVTVSYLKTLTLQNALKNLASYLLAQQQNLSA